MYVKYLSQYSVVVATFRRRGTCSDLAKLLPACLTRVTATCLNVLAIYYKGTFLSQVPNHPNLYKTSGFHHYFISLEYCSLDKG